MPYKLFAKRKPLSKNKMSKKMNTRSNKSNNGKSVSSIITEYLNVSISGTLISWFQIGSRNEKIIVENLKGPIVKLLLQRYEYSEELNSYINITKNLRFFLEWPGPIK